MLRTTYKLFNYTFILLLLIFIFSISISASAQKHTTAKKLTNTDISKKNYAQNTSKNKPSSKKTSKQEPISKKEEKNLTDTNSINNITSEELENYKEKTKQIISFFEFSLNTIGNDSTSVQEREIIINSSFSKIFRDESVLIEDDLDENRNATTYKEVQAYLRDVHYFYKNIYFEFNIENIDAGINDEGKTFFTATLLRHLIGIDMDGDTINTIKKRYIEVNLNEEEKNLQIVSIYSSRFNESAELTEWWSTLSNPWKKYLTKDYPNKDSINLNDIKKIINTENIDISENKEISDLSPLDKFTKLKTLNISGTKINSLQEIRNLTLIESLIADQSLLNNLDPIKYCSKLKEISLGECPLQNIDVLQNFKKLEDLNLNKTKIKKIESIASLTNLKKLECNNNQIEDITPLKKLTRLSILDLSSNPFSQTDVFEELLNLYMVNISYSKVAELNHFSKLSKLKFLNVSGTLVQSLMPIAQMEIQKIYCENTGIKKEEASAYVNSHPSSLVICQSQDLMEWWNLLDVQWKNVFRKYIPMGNIPDKEQLASVLNLTSIHLDGIKEINELSPLHELSNLKEIYLNGTSVETLEPIAFLDHLQIIEFEETDVNSLSPLLNLNHLQKVNCNRTQVGQKEVIRFVSENQQILVIYKTEELTSWWMFLNEEWKGIFKNMIHLDEIPNEEQLHKLVKLDSVSFYNTSVKTLEPLLEFHNLEILRFSNTQISDLCPLTELKKIKILQASKSPIKSIAAVSLLPSISFLDIDNTAVQEIKPLENSIYLKTLKCAGTLLRNLKNLTNLPFLNTLDISNTRISSIKPILKMNSLKTLICFNTSISEKKLSLFKKMHPAAKVVFY